jgi:hypothetical protein
MKIFISYSRKDSDIARMLDSSLTTSGVETFLDERDILVGESFPERIYEGIGSASHLAYLISENSVTSRWVQEELSIAKVREKEEKGFKILPLLIEDVLLPTAVKHVQYADFRNWRDQDAYRRSLLNLLRSIGVEPRVIGREDVKWYIRNGGSVRGYHSLLYRIYGEIQGGLAASYIPGPMPAFPMAFKWAFWEDDVLGLLRELEKMLRETEAIGSDRLLALALKVKATLNFGAANFAGILTLEDTGKMHTFWVELGSVCAMLDEFRGEMEHILVAGIELG